MTVRPRPPAGQTETINIVANCAGLAVKPGSMGRPVPGFDVDVVDEAGRRLGDGEVGHVGVRTGGGPRDRAGRWPPGLFRGYDVGGGGLDTTPFHDGWYYTGDLATRDAGGYLWFVGRADDLISSAGYRISPFEVSRGP